jgi:hypothetical protein
VTETLHQLACMFVSIIHIHGTSMDVPRDRLPRTRLGYDVFAANYVIRGCTRLHLCDRNTSPACMHDYEYHTYTWNTCGCSTLPFTLYKVRL